MPATATLTATSWPVDVAQTADLSAAIATAATVSGDAFAHQGAAILLVKNGDSGSHTITIPSVAAKGRSLNTADDIVRTLAAGKITAIGPFSAERFRDSNGLVQVTYDAVTAVVVKVVAVAVVS